MGFENVMMDQMKHIVLKKISLLLMIYMKKIKFSILIKQ